MTPHRNRRRSAPAGVALAVALLVVAGALPARADDLSEKRAEAERIARQLEEQSRRVSILAEDLDEARLVAGKLDADIASAEDRVARTDERVGEVRRRVRNQAVEAYVRGGSARVLEMMSRQRGIERVEVRHQYVKAVTSSYREVLEELRAGRLLLQEERGRLDTARAAARDALARVEAGRTAAAAAEAAQRSTLARVRGELAELVEAEARRRAEEQARRAQAQIAARQEREAALAREREAAARARSSTTTTTASLRTPVAGPTVTTVRPTPPTTAPVGPGNGATPGPSKGAEAAVAEAKRQLGKPYQWGSPGPDSFDCSGLTSWAWRAGGKSLPHSSRAQYAATTRVAVVDVQIGDLLFYGDPIHHVGIYAGNGQMVEASQTGTPVRMASIYRSDMVGVGRVN